MMTSTIPEIGQGFGETYSKPVPQETNTDPRYEQVTKVQIGGKTVTMIKRQDLVPEDAYGNLCRASAYAVAANSIFPAPPVGRPIKDHLIKSNVFGSVYIEARTDPFQAHRVDAAQAIIESGRNNGTIRRPLRGIEIKDDTYAMLRVALSNGKFLPVLDAAGEIVNTTDGKSYTTRYTNFIIQGINEQRSEKQQIADTFGDAYIFFFGEQPRQIEVSGLLLNTADFNWRSEWWENYDRYFRGTRLVELGARVYLIYDDRILEGYILGAQATENAQSRETIPLRFTLFITGYSTLSIIGGSDYPKPAGDIDYSQITSIDQATKAYLSGRRLQDELSSDAVRRANIEGYQGHGRLLESALRMGLSQGDPSIQSYLDRAAWAVYGSAPAIRGRNEVGSGSKVQKANPPIRTLTRKTPLRTKFSDNLDEFINRDTGGLHKEATEALSLSDQWLEADRRIDDAIQFSISTTDLRFQDLMGRPGRADIDIKQRASGGLVSNLGIPLGKSRNIPFGIEVFGDLDDG